MQHEENQINNVFLCLARRNDEKCFATTYELVTNKPHLEYKTYRHEKNNNNIKAHNSLLFIVLNGRLTKTKQGQVKLSPKQLT